MLEKHDFIKQFSQTVLGVNSSYCEINVTGLLLVYDSYFVHIIEVCFLVNFYHNIPFIAIVY